MHIGHTNLTESAREKNEKIIDYILYITGNVISRTIYRVCIDSWEDLMENLDNIILIDYAL